MSELRALIDGDILVDRCGFAAQHNSYSVAHLNDGEPTVVDCEGIKEARKLIASLPEEAEAELLTTTTVEEVSHALQNLHTSINNTLDAVGATSYTLYLTGKDNFREKLVDDYKANRDPTHKPYWYKEMIEYLVKNWGAVIVDGQEADDAMAIEQMKSPYGTTVICTVDKDLQMVPGYNYNYDKGKVDEIEELEGIRFFYKQIIQGDSTDNIPGIYKFTNKRQKATKELLQPIDSMVEEKDMWEYVQKVYEGMITDALITKARLLWMRREEGQMWMPPPHCRMGCIFYEGKLHGDCRAPSSDECALNQNEKEHETP